jgi:hypothetical protein
MGHIPDITYIILYVEKRKKLVKVVTIG